MDAVIHNAGLYTDAHPFRITEGHPRVLAVNVLAPYLLTALMHKPDRLLYVTSDLHQSGTTTLDDLDWTRRRWKPTQAYCDSKLLVTALARAVARRWPHTRCNAVDPGWVLTRMGGPHATDNLELGSTTQVWLAINNDPAAGTTGAYWHHQRQLTPAPAASDPRFQETVLNNLAEITGSALSAG
jgi:NAD(P)-dependent dehydrogenase (short-subunit alcohol dehydrogenase family)